MTTRRRFLHHSMVGAAAVAGAAVVLPPKSQAASAAQRTGSVRTKDGAELFVKDWGTGRPVVLTHAWPVSADIWDQQAIALVDAGYRVIAYDRRGFGRSSQPNTGYNYDTYADDVATVIKSTDAHDVTLIGFSMGGGEIVRYLSRHGARNVVKAGLVATVVPGLAKNKNNPGGVDPAFFDTLKDGLRKDRPTFLAGLLRDVFFDVETSKKSTNPVSDAVLAWTHQMAMQAGLKALIESVDAFGKEDFVPDLSAVTVPTLILHGTADKPTPFDLTAKRAAAGIRQAKLVAISGASHGLLVTERERVTKELLTFLKE